jgi:serine protease
VVDPDDADGARDLPGGSRATRMAARARSWWPLWVVAAGVLLVWAGVAAYRSSGPGEAAPTTIITTTTLLDPVDLVVVVDERIEPVVSAVDPLEGETGARPVGRVQTEDGIVSDFVVGELVVIAPDVASVEAIRGRDDIEVVVVDGEDADPEDGIEVLVRLRSLEPPDLVALAHHLAALEPGLTGTLRVDGDATAATLGALARLAVVDGFDVSLNDVGQPAAIPDGEVWEGFSSIPNAFEWSYVRSTAAQGIGLDTAWQMLYHHGRQENRVVVMVVDRGFQPNGDFPSNSTMRKGEWGPAGDDWTCTGGNPCPYHGTQVAVVIAGRVGNDYGVAGVAGPFADLVALHAKRDSWDMLRDVRRVAREERPDVISMSFGTVTTVSVNATRRRYDRTFRIVANRYGALAFASAGNEGIDVDAQSGPYLPCASDHVICVGGMGVDATTKAGGSNYGSRRDDRSVELYGPFCVYVMADPSSPPNGSATSQCGTSYSAPFVAGVAALLRVADPSLSPGAMQQILYDTAHVGGLGPLVTGHLRRVNAHMAVARALGAVWIQPSVVITSGGGKYPIDEVISLAGTARSYTGEVLPIRWHSSIDGWLNDVPQVGSIGAVLSVGDHLVKATAIDRRGFSGVANVIVTIENRPPVVSIVAPADGATIYAGTAIHLVGYTHDPDPYYNAALPDAQVRWTVEAAGSGSVVWEASAHAAVTVLDAGNYVIRFRGTDDQGASAQDSVAITVLPLQPGWVPPTATILRPAEGTVLHVSGGTGSVDLRGLARGVDGNVISGLRYRWSATSDNGHTVVLCVGSGFPGQGTGGGFVITKDCAEVTVELGLAPGAVGRTVWALRFEAVDPQGVSVAAHRSLEVSFATG